jgi:para-nitrobenzyl esterase
VWTPDPAAGLPVMVWIQGGGYLGGTSGRPEYDGSRLARDGVVVVTFNYRVGIEGFAQIDGAPANRGLLDQVAALEWVRDNIGAFGGDPGRVTVFGQSAGGGSVAALLAMPRAAGLFRRAIVQSMPGVYLTPELAADVGAALAAELDLKPAELATVPPYELPAVGDALLATIDRYADRWGLAAHGKVPLGPVVDGATLPTEPWQALAGGAARDVDLIAGHVRDEQRLFDLLEGTLGRITEEQAATALSLFAPGPDGAARYRAAGGSPAELYDRVHSDWLFRMPSLHLAEAHTGRTHVYELTWPAPGLDGVLGACHGLDVPLVFGNLTSGQPAMLLGDDLTEAEILSAQLRGAWTRFATDGDPGWPAYDENRLTRIFDTEPAVVPYPEEVSRQIWADHTFSALPLM